MNVTNNNYYNNSSYGNDGYTQMIGIMDIPTEYADFTTIYTV